MASTIHINMQTTLWNSGYGSTRMFCLIPRLEDFALSYYISSSGACSVVDVQARWVVTHGLVIELGKRYIFWFHQ